MTPSKGRFGKQESLKSFAIDQLLYKVKHETKPSCPLIYS